MNYNIAHHEMLLDNNRRYRIMRVKDMEEGDKPREKLVSEGAGALSAAELLAVVLGVGTKKRGSIFHGLPASA